MTLDKHSSFGLLLRQYRIAAHLSQEALAERSSLSAIAISALERGTRRTPRLETVHLLAEALRLTPEEQTALTASVQSFHALSEASPPPHNLPAELTSLIGREQDIAAVMALLQQESVRLLTLTGPPGVGKTRLALRVAVNLLSFFSDGVFFVSLAASTEPELALSTIAQVLGVKEAGGQPLLETLYQYLHTKHLLLVLDNFEQILTVAPTLTSLLSHCSGLTLLVTSRTILSVQGEHEYTVAPLHLPTRSMSQSLEDIAQSPAVQLFIERVRASLPDFVLTSHTASTIATICSRLDGLPLALELAAPRMKFIAPIELLHHLKHRLVVLVDGARDMPARQQTLRSALSWSYDLLNQSEQKLLQRIALFRGSATLAALEALTSDEEIDVLNSVGHLVNHSLLQSQEHVNQVARFSMLETIREYGLERLQASDEQGYVQRRYALYFLTLAQQIESCLEEGNQEEVLSQLETEHENLRGALEWARNNAEIELELCLASALWPLWEMRGYVSEGRQWLDSALVRSSHASSSARAKALSAAGTLARMQGDYARAVSLHEEAVSLWRSIGEKEPLSTVLSKLGDEVLQQGQVERALALLEESLAVDRERGYIRGVASKLNALGYVLRYRWELEHSLTLLRESLNLYQAMGDKRGIAMSFVSIAMTMTFQENTERVLPLLENALRLYHEVQDRWGIASTLLNLGTATMMLHHQDRAKHFFVESLTLYQEFGSKQNIAQCLLSMALLAVRGRHEGRAALLAGAAESLRESIKCPLEPLAQQVCTQAFDEARLRYDPEAFSTQWALGRTLSMEQAMSIATADDSISE